MRSINLSSIIKLIIILLSYILIGCDTMRNYTFSDKEYSGINTTADSITEYYYTVYYSIPPAEYDNCGQMEQFNSCEYYYKDTLIFYIVSGITSPGFRARNSSDEDSLSKIIINACNGQNTYFNADSLVLEGINENGRYWKNIMRRGVQYGYSNVPPEKLEIFENAIKSVRKVYDTTISYRNWTKKRR